MTESQTEILRPYKHLGSLAVAAASIAALEYAALLLNYIDEANRAGPVALGLIAAWALLRLLRVCPMLLMSAFPWVLIATIAFFCVGPLVLVFGNRETINSYHSGLVLNQSQLLETNILNASFMSVLFATFWVSTKGSRVSRSSKAFLRNLMDLRAAKTLTILCVVIGGPIKLFLSIPLEFGLLDSQPPSSILRLGQMTTLALIPAWFLLGSRKWAFAPLAILLLVAEILLALVMFAKTPVLLCLVFSAIGLYLARRNRKVLVASVVLLVTTYVILFPIVTTCRENGGMRSDLSLQRRVDLFTRVVWDENGMRSRRRTDGVNRGWRRLNYANNQHFVMRLYERGDNIEAYENALWVFVPRFVVPSKPNMTKIGTDRTFLLNGHRSGSVGITIPGEAYGFGGPACVVVVAVIVGLILSFVDTGYAFARVGGWLFLPVQIISMRMGYRLDGALVPDYLGSVVIAITYSFIVGFLVSNWFVTTGKSVEGT